MKKIILVSLLLTGLAGCFETKDGNGALLPLAFLQGQISGNCATIFKTTAGSVNSYSVSANTIPRGGCNGGTLLPTVTTDTGTYYTAQRTAVQNVLDRTPNVSACATPRAALQALLASTGLPANGATTPAISVGGVTAGCNNQSGGAAANLTGQTFSLPNFRTIFCSNAAATSTYTSSYSFVQLTDIRTEITTYSTNIGTAGSNGFTTDNSLNLTVWGPNELVASNQVLLGALAIANATSAPACVREILNANTSFRSLVVSLVSIPGIGTLTPATKSAWGISATDISSAVPAVINVTCGYASNSTIATNGTTGNCNFAVPLF